MFEVDREYLVKYLTARIEKYIVQVVVLLLSLQLTLILSANSSIINEKHSLQNNVSKLHLGY
jgi:hypothetical protein